MNWPREVCSAVSVAQTGTMALRMPVPIPLTALADAPHRQSPCACEQKRTTVLTTYHPVVVLRRALQSSTYNSPQGTEGNSFNSPDLVADPTTKEAPQ